MKQLFGLPELLMLDGKQVTSIRAIEEDDDLPSGPSL